MKLYDVPEGSKIIILEDCLGPPGEGIYPKGTALKFSHIDGMYSVCFNDDWHRVYLPASADVEIV